jgi:hypothetical protein
MGELYVRWQVKGYKAQEVVSYVNFDTSYPVPRSTRRTGMFCRILSKRRQLSVQFCILLVV